MRLGLRVRGKVAHARVSLLFGEEDAGLEFAKLFA